ncbi:unnamed protein product [Closterium sp. Yama58-4]|nr:unnamed protein product [Closterium sp. Yama58-4]
MAATAAAGCKHHLLRPLPSPAAAARVTPARTAVTLSAPRGASKLPAVRATAAPPAGKQQSPPASAGPAAQSQFSSDPATMSHSTRGSKDTAIRAASSLSVIERDVTSPDVNGNGAANGASASVNSSKQQLELEILPSFVPQELTAAADISEAFLSLESSALLSLPVLEPATSPQRQESEAEAAEERGNNSSCAEVTYDAGKEKEDESWLRLMTQAGYSKRMQAIGDQFFESDLRPVVLFDGVCNLCNKWVNFLLDYDPLGNLRFASLQGDSGKALLRRAGRDENDHSDIVLVAHNKAYFGSDAILQIFSRLKPPFPLLAAAGHITPHALHDFIYKTVSESRYTLFGKAGACRLFDPRFGQRFLPSDLSQE